MSEINLHNADCMEGMKEYPDNHFDLAIVDVPYGINTTDSFHMKTQSIDKRNGRPIKAKRKISKSKWDKNPPPPEYFDLLKMKSKNQIVWGANHFIDNFPFMCNSPCWIVWDKVNGLSDQSDCELAWTSFNTAVRKLSFMWTGLLQGKGIINGKISEGNISLKEKRIHPTQKPIALYKWLLKNYAKPGDKILDTHLGSGSICIACYDMDYDLTGFEIDKDYFKAMTKRFENHKKQLQIKF